MDFHYRLSGVQPARAKANKAFYIEGTIVKKEEASSRSVKRLAKTKKECVDRLRFDEFVAYFCSHFQAVAELYDEYSHRLEVAC